MFANTQTPHQEKELRFAWTPQSCFLSIACSLIAVRYQRSSLRTESFD